MNDVRFSTGSYDFSYRAAGIVVADGSVLLQRPVGDDEFALPGGGVKLGETSAEALAREFAEEIGAKIEVGKLRWAEEVFWAWNGRPNHQISLYFDVRLIDSARFQANGGVQSKEQGLEFLWIPIKDLSNYVVYPERTAELLALESGEVKHWVRRENGWAAGERL